MIVPMAHVRLVGSGRLLVRTLEALHRLRAVELLPRGEGAGATGLAPFALGEERGRRAALLRDREHRLAALIALAPCAAPPGSAATDPEATPEALREIEAELSEVGPRADALVRSIDALRHERAALPRHIRTVRRLLPFVSDVSELTGHETVALLVERRAAGLLDVIRGELNQALGERFELVSAPLDADTVGALVVVPRGEARRVHALLGREQVSRLGLPADYERLPLRSAVKAMEERVAAVSRELIEAERALQDLLGPRLERFRAARRAIARALAALGAVEGADSTGHAFVLSAWAPRDELPRIARSLAEMVGPEVALEETPLDDAARARAPVALSNRGLARPFESLVRLYGLPLPGTLDPTPLMAAFLPVFLGMMLGDVAHGLVILALALFLRRRLGPEAGIGRDIADILVLGALWGILFGVLFGEALGELGHALGMRPILFSREEALVPLFLLSIGIGAAHVVLGLVIGAVLARRLGNRHALLERLAMLLAVLGLFAVAGAAAEALPRGALAPGAAAVAVALAVLIALGGRIALVTAPLEIVGVVSNVLSYLRIAAIGLAGVYLSRVANELGSAVAPLALGLLVAALLHALNVALGAFSPTVQALRLHYVEFFGKFYEGGGRAFAPFGGEPAA